MVSPLMMEVKCRERPCGSPDGRPLSAANDWSTDQVGNNPEPVSWCHEPQPNESSRILLAKGFWCLWVDLGPSPGEDVHLGAARASGKLQGPSDGERPRRMRSPEHSIGWSHWQGGGRHWDIR